MKGLLFTYLMTYGGAAVALFNPYIGLLIYICFAIIKPDALWFWSVPEGNYSRTIAIALLVGWAFRGFGDWRFGRGRAIVVSAVAYLAWCAVASFSAPDQQLAWGFTEATGKIILPVVVGATLIDSTRKLKQLAWVIALSEGYLAWEFNVSYFELGPYNRLNTMGFAGMEEKSVAVGMVIAGGVAFFLGLDAKAWWAKLTAFGAAALMMHVPLFTFTRGGMLGLIAVALTAFLIIPKRPIHYITLALMIALGLRLAGPEVREQFMTSFTAREELDTSAEKRVEHWQECCQTIAQYPLTGIGPRHWPWHWKNYYGRTHMEAHQTWLQLGAEAGVPGLAMLVLFMGLCAIRLWPYTRERNALLDPELRGISRAVISGLVGFGVASQFITLYLVELPFYVALMGIGVLKIVSRRTPAADSPLLTEDTDGLLTAETARPNLWQDD
jgi:O-antigen ligase